MVRAKSKKATVTFALKEYQEGRITIGRAAELAGIPLREMMKIASKKKIPFQYSMENLKEDVKWALHR